MEEIYNEYSVIVYKYLLSLTHNADIAEELMQETFYSAVKNINKFRNEANLKNWLCKIAKNKWIDYYKKTKKAKEINIEEIDENILSINYLEEDYANRDALIDLYKKINKLDNLSKEVVYLRIRADFSFNEIGDIMGKSEEWARVMFYRAKIKLKEGVNDEQSR